jgi:hypothetical protein
MPGAPVILCSGTVRKNEWQSAHDIDRGGFEKAEAARWKRGVARNVFR